MYDVHKLRLLRELKLRGTVTSVGEALRYSPSTISQHLAQLESDVGVPLVEQVGRRLVLTSAAEVLIRHADIVLRQLEMAEADMAATRTDVSGVVRVAAFQTAALALIPPMLAALRERHPLLRVEVGHLQAQEAQAAVLSRDFDLVVTEEYPGGPVRRLDGLVHSPLVEDPLRMVVRAGAFPTSPEARLAAARELPWVMEPEGTAARDWAVRVCRMAGFEPDVRFEAADVLFQRQLVVEGHAAGFLPDLVWRTSPRPDGILSESSALGVRSIFTSVRAGAHGNPSIEACRAALAGAVGR